ncbi:hypothetical protein NPIL_632281 [Nephila pilipes]|uniref:Uncharacterized protein n=1 Tax=Nephila pilipes TaxID=299642 RepID=A0A8X6TWM6_NEPPI|nr:hypothetical protein NPIL_632281 [Nephila pilipes]
MQGEVTLDIGNTAAFRLATQCSVLKREQRRVIEEKNQLRKEVTDTKKRLGLTTASLQNSERKVKKLEEQLKKSDDMNNSLLAQNRALVPNSNTSEEILSPKNSVPNSVKATERNDKLNNSYEIPSVKKKRMEIVVLDKKVEKMTVTMSSTFPFPKTLIRNQCRDEYSVLRTGYNGLGGHDRVVLGTEKGKFKMHPKSRLKIK